MKQGREMTLWHHSPSTALALAKHMPRRRQTLPTSFGVKWLQPQSSNTQKAKASYNAPATTALQQANNTTLIVG